MFSLGGIVLDNDHMGWSVQASSEPYTGISRRSVSLTVPGRDGNPWVDADEDSPVISLVLRSTAQGLESLLALLDAKPAVLGKVGTLRVVPVELLSAAPALVPGDPSLSSDVRVLARFNDMFWRDKDERLSAVLPVASSPVDVEVMGGLSAPVRDAVIRVKGQLTGLQITDAGGTFIRYTQPIPTGSYFRYHSDTRRAFVTTTDTWAGGTEVTGLIEFGRKPFQITPTFTDPATRIGRLTVTSTARTSATIQVRGKNAYRV